MTEKKETPRLTHPFVLIDASWQAYLKRIPFFTKLVLAPALFYLLLDTLTYVSEHGVAGQPLVLFAQSIEHTMPLSISLYVIALVVQLFSNAAIFVSLTDGHITSVSTAYQNGAKKILSFFWVTILSSFVIGGGFLLLLIPGIIFSVWFAFSDYIFFAEQKKGIRALLQSREYVRGYFWQIAGRILFITLIVAALSSISGYISILFQNGLVSQIAQSIVSLVTVPLSMLYQYKLYEDIRIHKSEVVIKGSGWWYYIIASLLPFILIILGITLFFFTKPFHVSDNSMQPTYKQGESLLLGEFPAVTGTTTTIIYQKEGELLLRRVLASSGERLRRKGDTVYVVTKDGGNTFFSHANTYALSFFSPALPLADGKELAVGKNEIYITVENAPAAKQTWEKITNDQVVGVPLFCYWNCTGKE